MLSFFEASLKNKHPHATQLTYSAADVQRFLENLGDISCLIGHDDGRYLPHGREWLKDAVYKLLVQAGRGGADDRRQHNPARR